MRSPVELADLLENLREVANSGARHSALVKRTTLLGLPVVERRARQSSDALIRARVLQGTLRDIAKCLEPRERDYTRWLLGLPPNDLVTSGVRKGRAAEAAGYEYSYFRRPEIIREHLQPVALKLLEWNNPLAEERDLGLHDEPGLLRYFNDIVEMPPVEWEALFETTDSLDLVINYAATWRNTYLKHLEAIAAGGRLRVVLPDTSPRSPVVSLLARRHSLSTADFRKRVMTARTDFSGLADGFGVTIYETSVAFHHAAYIFSSGAVIALYALSGQRIPTPALLVGEGGLLSFVRNDFERLVSTNSSRCWQVFP